MSAPNVLRRRRIEEAFSSFRRDVLQAPPEALCPRERGVFFSGAMVAIGILRNAIIEPATEDFTEVYRDLEDKIEFFLATRRPGGLAQ